MNPKKIIFLFKLNKYLNIHFDMVILSIPMPDEFLYP
jgi:hypothetical protein